MKYVLISDVHANHIALQAVLDYVENRLEIKRNFHYLFLGDLVGYGSLKGALWCIRWLRSRMDVDWIPGNHDEWILNHRDHVQGGAALSLLAQRCYLLQPGHREDFTWFEQQVNLAIQQRPILVLSKGGRVLFCTHGTTTEGGERGSYLYPWKPSLIKWDLLQLRKKCPGRRVSLLYGHTHFPLISRLQNDDLVYDSIQYGKPQTLRGDLIAINPGSVGQPRDGDPRSSFAILDTQTRTVTFHRVEYDINAMAIQLEADGNFGSRLHPLSWDERDTVIAAVKQGSDPLDPQEIYAKLIERLRAGNKDANLSLYQDIYHRVEDGIRVVHQ